MSFPWCPFIFGLVVRSRALPINISLWGISSTYLPPSTALLINLEGSLPLHQNQRALFMGGSITVRLVSSIIGLDSIALLHAKKTYCTLNWRPAVQRNFPYGECSCSLPQLFVSLTLAIKSHRYSQMNYALLHPILS